MSDINVSTKFAQVADAHVERLMTEITGAVAVVISTADGFEVAARARDTSQSSRLSAMASSIAAIGAVIGEETLTGACRGIFIEADSGRIVMVEIRHPEHVLILTIVTDEQALLGAVTYSARQTALELANA